MESTSFFENLLAGWVSGKVPASAQQPQLRRQAFCQWLYQVMSQCDAERAAMAAGIGRGRHAVPPPVPVVIQAEVEDSGPVVKVPPQVADRLRASAPASQSSPFQVRVVDQ